MSRRTDLKSSAAGNVVRLADYKPSPQERHLVEQLGLTHPCIPSDTHATIKRGTPQSTVEALMYALRRGFACLEDDGNLDRLRRSDADAMEQIAARLIALGWDDDDVEKLAVVWSALRSEFQEGEMKKPGPIPANVHVIVDRAKKTGRAGRREGGAARPRRNRSCRACEASSIEMSAIEWFWPQRYALGKLGLLVEPSPTKGRARYSPSLAATATKGGTWPCPATKATSRASMQRRHDGSRGRQQRHPWCRASWLPAPISIPHPYRQHGQRRRQGPHIPRSGHRPCRCCARRYSRSATSSWC